MSGGVGRPILSAILENGEPPFVPTISLNVNGRNHDVDADPATPLVYVLRNQLALTGTKLGCGLEQCGACAVLIDGTAELSCTAALSDVAGKAIVTVEGLADGDGLHRVQQAFVDAGAAQCGYCIPGMVIAVAGLLNGNPRPTEDETLAALAGHLCRCGTHARVLGAVACLAGREAADD